MDECFQKGEETDFITGKEIKYTFDEWWLQNKEDHERKHNINKDELLLKVEGILGTKIIDRFRPYLNEKQLNIRNVIVGYRLIYINNNLLEDDNDDLD